MRRTLRSPAPSPRSSYRTVKVLDSPAGGRPIVWIIDLDQNGARSVTNDAENVCAELHSRYPNCRIIYRDTMGRWDELCHDSGRFTDYAPASGMGIALAPSREV